MRHTITTTKKRHRLALLLGGLVISALLLAACGGATTAGTTNSAASIPAAQAPSSQQHAPARTAAPSASNQGQGNTPSAAQYLIKSLAVNMTVKDTQKVASELQAWISTADPGSSSAGIDYEQVGDNLYSVSMQFEVRASAYTQIKLYLEDYASQHGGKLINLHETVQDVTGDVIDSQSRLKNLRGEQQRLLTLLSSATALGDILSIEQRLTDVEGQIEDLEAHLNALSGQTTFYTVAITLQPLEPATPPPPPPPSSTWSFLQTLQGAWAASVAFGEGLLTLLIWLASFGIYIIPVAIVGWFVWQRRRAKRFMRPLEASMGPSQTTP